MKAWRKAAEKINIVRRMIAEHNNHVPKEERITQLPRARVAAQRRELWHKANKGKGLLTTWLLSGLLIKGGYQPVP